MIEGNKKKKKLIAIGLRDPLEFSHNKKSSQYLQWELETSENRISYEKLNIVC